ncbi:MAG: YraN family protein [Candidatus Babeliales bacterium]|nr:YraN family protein [Candidatus Babeliales bacterium]
MWNDFNISNTVEPRRQFGDLAEDFVEDYLINNGFTISARNYRLKCGEIDIIATKNDVVAFVEVKSRKTNYFGLSEVITKSKQRKIILTAKYYISKYKLYNNICRFDVALLQKTENGFEIQYIANAFNESY